MQFSILVPVYNAQATLRATLDSALALGGPDTEILALDDGSSDDSWNVLQDYAGRIEVARQENTGGCAARNRLLEMSAAPFVHFLDADDIVDPGRNQQQRVFLENHPEIGVVTDTLRLFYDDPHEDGELFAPQGSDWWISLIRHRIPFTSSALWRREAIEAVGNWDESLPSGQEYDLYFRMLKQSIGIAHLDLAKTRYRMPSRNAPPKRDPARTLLLEAAFLHRVEAHLLLENALTKPRRSALAGKRLQLARKLAQCDRQAARQLAATLGRAEIAALSPQEGLPRTYLACAALLGFDMAETVADTARKRHAS
ncbi:MAG: glycosyltransferase family A protein [Alteraurantiacibacter sp.]